MDEDKKKEWEEETELDGEDTTHPEVTELWPKNDEKISPKAS